MIKVYNDVTKIEAEEVKEILPHREPFLFLEEVYDIKHGENVSGIGVMRLSEEKDDFFRGHFPGNPVMPGVIILELMAQTATVLGLMTMEDRDDYYVLYAGIDNAKFKNQVLPGDKLEVRMKQLVKRGILRKFSGEAYVGDKLCTTAMITAAVVPRDSETVKK